MKRSALLTLIGLITACGDRDAPVDSPREEAPVPEVEPSAARASRAENPETDAWLGELAGTDGTVALVDPVNVTDRAGYDSQPFFVDNTTVLVTREMDGQTDIWTYDVDTGEETRLTETGDSEFAPMPLPGGEGFSVVRREEDGRWRVWAYRADGTPAEVLFADVSPVDFYAWIDDETAFLYVMEDTATMRRATRGELGDPLSDRVTAGVAPSEDHAWTPDGMLLQPSGNVLHGGLPDGEGWRVLGEIPDAGLAISRVSVSPDGTRVALAAHPTGS